MLLDSTIVDAFSNEALVSAVVEPSPPPGTTYAFALSNANATLASALANIQPPPTAPPNATYVIDPGTVHGASLLTVTVGPPVDASATLALATYPVANIACRFRDFPALTIAADGTGTATSVAGPADFYQTEPQATNPLDPCGYGFLDPTIAGPRYNFPGGGLLIDGDVTPFSNVSASQWSPASTSATPPPNGRPIYLFKARNGLIVKAIVDGPYEVTSPVTGRFEY